MSGLAIGVVGLGGWGEAVARGLASRGLLAAVCDGDARVLAAFEGGEATLPRTTDYLALLGSDLNAVVVATPATSQQAMVMAALEAGKDVWASGPIGGTSEEARRLIERAQALGRLLHLGSLGVGDAVGRLLGAAGAVGRPWALRVERGAPTRTGMSHPEFWWEDVALAASLFDGLPERARTDGGAFRRAGQTDLTTLHLGWASGERASLHLDTMAPAASLRVTLHGEHGGLALAAEDARVTLRGWDADGEPRVIETGEPAEAQMTEAAIEEWIAALLSRSSNPQRVEVLRRTTRLIEAGRCSLDEGRPVDPASLGFPLGETETPAIPARRTPTPAPLFPAEATIDPSARIHPTVAVDGPVRVGAGTSVWHFSKLLGPLSIGEGCTLGQNVVVERGVEIGRNVKIQNNVSVYSGVILEDDVFCGPSMVFTNVGTPRSGHPRRGQYTITRVRRGASVGANATIVCGNTLGQYCFVGAGSVVTRDVPDYGLVYGNPARLRGWACFCGATLPLELEPEASEQCACGECGRQYAREGHRVWEVSR